MRRFQKSRKGNKVEAGPIQNKFDTHEDADGVPSGKHREHTQAEKKRTHNQKTWKAIRHYYSPLTLRLTIRTAPTNATRSNTEATSKGMRYLPSSRSPIAAEVG